MSRLVCAAAALLAVPLAASAQPAQALKDRYIVVLNRTSGPPAVVAEGVARMTGGRIGYVYEHALRGFSITMPAAAAARLATDGRVASIEPDVMARAFAQTVPTGVSRSFAAGNSKLDIDGTDDVRVDVDIAILDTGIDREHPDLNVVGGTNCLSYTGSFLFRTYYCDAAKTGDDDHYHGTHVAGTAAALDNGIGPVGVAPGARLWAVKVLDQNGSGALSAIIAGIDWVTARGDIEVINMSLGAQTSSTAMNTAVANAVKAGVSVVVAAGNSDADASLFTPANAPDAVTVSALADFDGVAGGAGAPTCRADQDDTLADFSNWGSRVDIAAPGVCIYSTYPIEKGSYNTISGTSMASPHAAGAAAILRSRGVAASQIRSTLKAEGNAGWTDDSGDGTKEPLLDLSDTAVFAPVLVQTGSGGATPVPLSVSFSWSASGLTATFNETTTPSTGATIQNWVWNFGDGNTVTINGNVGSGDTSHSYAAANTYTVTLTAFDSNGSKTATANVTVSAPKGGGPKKR